MSWLNVYSFFKVHSPQHLKNGYIHEAQDFDPDSEHLKWLHRITGNAKAFINGTCHGTSTKHLQMYLSELCYRFNRRLFGGAIFVRLLVPIAGWFFILWLAYESR